VYGLPTCSVDQSIGRFTGRCHAFRIADAANAKRSKAAKEQPRNADGTMAEKPVVGQSVPLPDEHKGRAAKAAAAGVNAATQGTAFFLQSS